MRNGNGVARGWLAALARALALPCALARALALPCALARALALPWALLLLVAMPTAALAKDVPQPPAETLAICAGCHTADGNATIPQHPRLAGLDAKYLEQQLRDFRSGARKSAIMGPVAGSLNSGDLPVLAAYFSAQKPKPNVAADPSLVAAGKAIYDNGVTATAVPSCSGCHDVDGKGDDRYPRIAGQNSAYTVDQLLRYKSGERNNDKKNLMRAVAKRLSEAEIRAVAEYVATLKGDSP